MGVVEVPQIEHVQGETKHIHQPVQGGRQAHPAQVMHVEEEGPAHPADAPVQVFAAPPPVTSTVVAQPVTTGSVTVAPTTVQAPVSSVVVPQTYAAPATYAAAPAT